MRKSELKKAVGKIPADNKKEFLKIIEAVINQWGLTRPVDIMSANRMVSTWMKMRYIEECLLKYGMFFEENDQDGKLVRIKVNELSYYLKQLESDFRAYYRLLSQNNKTEGNEKESFLDWIETDVKK
jgi:hypothetical protein|tara:strand:- start:7919 stop:8299 length:381 start_codon:yes stop_codon:yes gene_type:complete